MTEIDDFDENNREFEDLDETQSIECQPDELDDDDEEEASVRNMQEVINKKHPFGIKIWKPALYKKNRSIEKTIYDALHTNPQTKSMSVFSIGNILWVLLFGWWICLGYFISSFLLYVFMTCLKITGKHFNFEYQKVPLY